MVETYKPDPKAIVMEWWELDCGDIGTKLITNKQLDFILEAEKRNLKLVRFDDFVVNIAFIRGANKKTKTRTLKELEYSPLSENDQKFLVVDNRQKLLEKGC